MTLIHSVKISFNNLMAVKFRSFLSILGIVIGVASVILIFSTGASGQKYILDRIQGVGSNLVAVLPGAADEEGPPAAAFGISVTTLTYDDLLALTNKKNVPQVEAGAGYVSSTLVTTYKENKIAASITGVSSDYLNVENGEIAEGRFFTQGEDQGMARVAVLGTQIKEDLFNGRNAINEKVKIKGKNYTVIGVFKERGSAAFGSNQDGGVFIPLKTAQKQVLGINHLGFIRLKVSRPEEIGVAKANIKATLRDRHNITNPSNDDFSVRDLASALAMIEQVTDALRYFLLAIGAVSLLVGGVGIMNIMLIAVNQRIWEIGLRKAVGARNNDVLIQFLVESSTVSLIGGILGIIIGLLTAFVAAVVINKLGVQWDYLISGWSLVTAVSVSIGVGILFGLYPAKKASKISPMEALHYE